MRNELNNIEKIDQYINGLMTDADKVSFESSIAADPALAQVVDGQKLFLQAVKRKALRAEIIAVTGAGAGAGLAHWKIISMILGGTGVVVLAAVLIINANGDLSAEGNDLALIETTNDVNDSFEEVIKTPLIDSLIEELGETDTTLVESASTFRRSSSKSSTSDFVYGEDTPCDGLKTMVMPDIQQHHMVASKGKTVEGDQGTVVIIPPNAFLDQNDQPVVGNVHFKLVEALTLEDMLLYNLTTTDGDKLLETGGMIYVEATQNDEKLKINPDAPLYIEIPTDDFNPKMVAFKGEVNDNGDISWKNPTPLKKYLAKVDLADLDFLPEGFEEEVHGTMPFKGHKRANDELVDSLYYALANPSTQPSRNAAEIIENDFEKITSSFDTANYRMRRKDLKVKSASKSRLGNLLSRKTIANYRGGNCIVKGSVVDKLTNEAVPFATVYIYEDGILVNAGETDIEGNFAFSNMAAGANEMEVEAFGFITQRMRNVNITSGLIKFVDFKLSTPDGATGEMLSEVEVVICPEILLGGDANNASLEFMYAASNSKFSGKCGINPMSIQTIRTKAFANTFIATKEFEERLAALHHLDNGQELFDIYIGNLNKDLSTVDGMVAQKMTGEAKKKFEAYATLNLTNIKDAQVHQEQLSAYYKAKRNEFDKKQKRAKARYDRMNTAELKQLQTEFDKLSASIGESVFSSQMLDKQAKQKVKPSRVISEAQIQRVSQRQEKIQRLASVLPKPRRAVPRVYATPWYETGWVNIDNYLHMLQKGSKDVKVLASSEAENVKVYQWLNVINTVVGVSLEDGEGLAKFPTKSHPSSHQMKNAICFSMSNNDGDISYGENRFNPYNEKQLSIELLPIGEEELRSRLSSFDAGRSLNRMLDHVENQMKKAAENRIKAVAKAKLLAEKAEAKRILEAKREAERQAEIARKAALEKARRDKLKKERTAVNEEILKEQDRLRAEYEYMENLRRVAFPCLPDICVVPVVNQVVKNPNIDVTNVFTPNDDGRDDVWTPVVNNVKSAGIIIRKPKSETIVFQGELPNLTWNGKDEKGEIAKIGDYRFTISGIALNGQEFTQEGVVSLRMSTRVTIKPSEQ